MIQYQTTSFVWILRQISGTSFQGPAPFRAFCTAFISFIYTVLNEYFDFYRSSHLTPSIQTTMTVSNIFLGLLMSFRVNSAFQQWRSGVVAISALEDAARTLMSTSCSFSYVSEMDIQEKKDQVYFFLTELRRLIILYVSIVFHGCRGIDNLSDLRDVNLMTEDEFQELQVCKTEVSFRLVDKNRVGATAVGPTKLRSTAVELWIRRIIDYARRKDILVVPQSNALNTIVNQLSSLFQTVFIIAHIPIPFNYSHFLKGCIALHLTLYTLVITAISRVYTPIWVFLWGLLLFCADDVANEIECPFGIDPNDIDFEARLLLIEEELTVLLRSHYHLGELCCKADNEIEKRMTSGAILDSELVSTVGLTISTPLPNDESQPAPSTGIVLHKTSPSTFKKSEFNEYTPLLI